MDEISQLIRAVESRFETFFEHTVNHFQQGRIERSRDAELHAKGDDVSIQEFRLVGLSTQVKVLPHR